nr:hypothetical protein [Tanacetum cinerariifolium]
MTFSLSSETLNTLETSSTSLIEKTPKPNYVRKKAGPETSPKQKHVQATKGTKIKTKTKVAKYNKKKQPAKMPKAKGLAVLSKVALTKVEQLKLDTKRSKTYFHSSHTSGSSNGVNTRSKVPGDSKDEDDVNDSDNISDEGDNDNDGNNVNDGDDDDANDDDKQESDDDNDDNNGNDGDDDANDDDKQESDDKNDDDEEIDKEEKINDEETMDEEEDDEVTKELYDDVNVNLENEDTDQGDSKDEDDVNDSDNISDEGDNDNDGNNVNDGDDDDANDDDKQESDDKNDDDEETDSDRTKSDKIKIYVLNQSTTEFYAEEEEKIDDEETIDEEEYDESRFKQEEEDAHVTLTHVIDTQKTGGPTQSSSVSSDLTRKLLNIDNPSPANNEIASLMDTTAHHATVIPEITSNFTITTPPPPLFLNPLSQQAVPTLTQTASEATTSLPTLPDFASAAATLSEFELTNILIDKMDKNKSFYIDDYKRQLYDALVKSYNTNKDIFESYGEVFSLKRSRDDKGKDQDPSAGADRGTKRRKSSKEAEPSRDSRSKEKKSSSTSKDASKSQHKSSGKCYHVEEPSNTIEDSEVQQDQEFETGNNDEQLADKEVTKADWFKKPERPPTPDPDWSTCKSIMELEYHFEECSKATTECLGWHNPKQNGGDLSRRYSTSMTKTKAATYDHKWIKYLVLKLWSPVQVKYDQHAYLGTSHWGPKCQSFYGYASNMTSSKDVYFKRRIIAVTRLKIMKKYDYGHLDKIEVHREDQKLYTFRECDFKRLRLQDIEDMLLLLVQQKLTNLTIDERCHLSVVLRMNQTAYTSYLDPHGIIYVDQYRRKRLMRADELHKLMLNDVRSALHDIVAGIRMEYLLMRKWSNLDKKRARVMLQDIDKQLYQRRLLQNLEKFVGGREYKNDLRLLERTI